MNGWNDLIADYNRQNQNAANARDGPKHIAWLWMLKLLGDKLELIIETHAGGGIYRVRPTRFCIGLPDDSILSQHQKQAVDQLPPMQDENTWYSASGDQSLINLSPNCRYVAYETLRVTRNRLRILAEFRQRKNQFEASPGYAGNGDPQTGVQALLDSVPCANALVMIDPFEVNDLCRAVRLVCSTKSAGKRTIMPSILLFGCRSHSGGHGASQFEEAWKEIPARFKPLKRIEWRWTGKGTPDAQITSDFALLIAINETYAATLHEKLVKENEILNESRRESHCFSYQHAPEIL